MSLKNCRINREITESLTALLILLGTVFIVMATMTTFGWILVQYLGVQPEVEAGTALEYYLDTGAMTATIIAVVLTFSYWVFRASRVVYKDPSNLWNWLIVCDVRNDE